MSLAAILKFAALFGLDLDDLRDLAKRQGLPAARQFVIDYCRRRMTRAKPGILTNLAGKAPLDGKRRKDLDGIEMEDWQFFLHEADYLVIRAVVRRGGEIIDEIRDRHFPKLLTAIEASPTRPATAEALVDALIEAEIELTF